MKRLIDSVSVASCILILTLTGCSGSISRMEDETLESNMTELERLLANGDPAVAELCINYIFLCERATAMCLEATSSPSTPSFCSDLPRRCQQTVAAYCDTAPAAETVLDGGNATPEPTPDAGARIDGGSLPGPSTEHDAGPSSPSVPDAGVPVSNKLLHVGPREVVSTGIEKGTLFVSPAGSGTSCTKSSPCDIWTAIAKAQAGDVVFLFGGMYPVSKTINFYNHASAPSPVIFESLPGETAIFDGSQHSRGTTVRLTITGSFVHLRKVEVRHMPVQGIWIGGTDNVVEGVHVWGSGLSGIQVYSPYSDFPYGSSGSRNTIRDCIVHDNSGAGLFDSEFANGGNSDGISISSGADNRVEHCLVYHNSDDGIDSWRSTGTYIGYSISHSNGIADGNGNGIKAGGLAPSRRTLVEHCVSYSNVATGIDFNSGAEVRFVKNTSWDNQIEFVVGPDTVVTQNLTLRKSVSGTGIQSDNSWQRPGTAVFLSTDVASPQFLVPLENGGFDDIGAYSVP